MKTDLNHFNIRVYGLLINSRDEILVSDEYVLDTRMTKFPGGGLKFGEGPEDCVLREFREELGQEARIVKHFYTTGFYQKALFYPDHQLISIYYLVELIEEPTFRISQVAFDFEPGINGSQSFRWMKIKELKEKDFTFPVDRHVIGLLKSL